LPISEISKEQYTALDVRKHCDGLWPAEDERAWFANPSNTLVGVLVHRPEKDLWGHSICLRDGGGKFRRIEVADDIPTAELARLDLVATMKRLA
jgi:hypothetical protein